MTRRPYLDDRDPAEAQEWRETSHAGIRRMAREATAAAVAAAKDRRLHDRRVTAEGDDVTECLWVRDAERRGQDPEPVRCRPGGYVSCRPCLDRHDRRVTADNADNAHQESTE